jgi:hypothetical protein
MNKLKSMIEILDFLKPECNKYVDTLNLKTDARDRNV